MRFSLIEIVIAKAIIQLSACASTRIYSIKFSHELKYLIIFRQSALLLQLKAFINKAIIFKLL